MKALILVLISLLILWVDSYAMMSIEDERKLGEKLLIEVKKQVKLVNDPEIVSFVNRVSRRVLEEVDGRYFDFKFYVIEDSSLNAFAMPGGHIFINSGILMHMESEDDLASVIAHEIGHIQGRHIAKRISTMQKMNIANIAIAVTSLFLGSPKSSQALVMGSTALALSASLKYSRQDEEEADRRAYDWLCKAGYNPHGLINVMKKIIQNRWMASDGIPSYLSTHPSSSERLTYLTQLTEFKPCNQNMAHRSEAFYRVKAISMTLGRSPIESIKYFSSEVSKNPDDFLSSYALFLSYVKNRQYSEALNVLKTINFESKALKGFDMGKVYYLGGEYKKAIEMLSDIRLSDELQVAKNYYLGSSYLEVGEAQKAISLFKDILDSYADPAELYFKLGRAYALQQRVGEAHYYFYKHYLLIDDMKNAKYHKEKALEHLDKNSVFYREISQ